MDPTSRFFSRLRKLAVTLESETSRLQQTFESRKEEPDRETTAKAMGTYHELNFSVGSLKAQIQEQLVQQKAHENEVDSFIQACRTMEQKVSRDVQILKAHWEEYGYQAPTKAQEAEDEGPEEGEAEPAEREGGGQEEDGENLSSSPPAAPTFSDVMRTPQLSDFGLSEMQLKRTLAGAEWCSEVPPMPEMNLPHPALSTPAPPLLPLTPKRALRMEDEELQTPQMHDFGISEDNDFTAKLLQKNAEEPHRPAQDQPGPPEDSVLDRFQTRADILASPELPVLCTPGLKIRKTNGRSSSSEPDSGEPESPTGPNLPSTPQVPAFQTPYMTRLVSTKKSFRQPEPISLQSEELPASPPKGAPGSKRCWENKVLEVCETGLGDEQMPEMPSLESVLGNSLQRRNPKVMKLSDQEKLVADLELDGATQEFSLGTPRIRSSYQEPGTPEMPDLSSVTQDICKLVSQAQLRKTITTMEPQVRAEKPRNRSEALSVVSDGEFQSLPNYLRQVTLHNLNQAVHNINAFTEQRPGGTSEFQMDQLKRIIGVGTLAPVYVLCLTELKRLKHVGGVKENSVYKLISKH
ncbi:spindle and kinetochore-associated protein 3 isoform X1 [Acanthochromis polyacanthus]|uniref:spindle and kinetochore-associated protein 3 isoform X1 n=1 Tax=Acanthochromis polyacanthus TaxID=80966 RepID=UPI00223415B8|nr:spindle and kinetochore-associated protein 3 isoform X1 [Acanthochromis polyacanthus]